MAFNVQENAVFIPEFSEISLCPPPPLLKNHSYIRQWMHSFKLHHNFCSYRIRHPTRNRRVGGGGGGGRHERPPFFFSSFQNSQVLQKLNHVVSPPPPPLPLPHFKMDLRPWLILGLAMINKKINKSSCEKKKIRIDATIYVIAYGTWWAMSPACRTSWRAKMTSLT